MNGEPPNRPGREAGAGAPKGALDGAEGVGVMLRCIGAAVLGAVLVDGGAL